MSQEKTKARLEKLEAVKEIFQELQKLQVMRDQLERFNERLPSVTTISFFDKSGNYLGGAEIKDLKNIVPSLVQHTKDLLSQEIEALDEKIDDFLNDLTNRLKGV